MAITKKKEFRLRSVTYSLANIDSAATTRKAMPAQNRSPVKNHTTTATRIAGMSTKKSLISTMIIKPMITKITSAVRSSPILPRIDRTTVKRTVLSKNIPQENFVFRR
jgi:hypothetical protein